MFDIAGTVELGTICPGTGTWNRLQDGSIACLEQLSMYKSSSEARPALCPFTAAIECDLLVGSSSPKLRLASYQLCISFLIPSHLISSPMHRQ